MIYWGSAASFLFFTATGYLAARFFNFDGQVWYFFMTLMGMLGLTSSALFYYFQNKWSERKAKRQEAQAAASAAAAPAGAGPAPDAGEAQQWVKDANARLGQSKPGVGIENLPMIFVVGDRGTAKTSVILNSGLEPELLAGQAYQEATVIPTRGANIFYARDNVFVEAGGALMASPAAWKSLVKKLRPGRLKTLGKSTQSPRGVLLCFDLETFTRQGAADAIGAAARYLHERLGEISQELGISFPVYVVFSRADRLPFFAEFVGNLTPDEAGQIVGVTLPLRNGTGGVYLEAETQRLSGAFDAIFYSFCDQRLRLLPREIDPMKVPGTYEFPREFRKLRQLLVQFLVDIGKPSQLRASPFLRGFYFSGIRPLTIQDMPAAPGAAAAQQPAQEVGGGATRMFRAGFQEQQKAMQAYAQQWTGPTVKKVPQWLFLGHLFNDLILADNVARAASGSSVKTSVARRILMGTAAALCLLYTGLATMSYFGNRTLEQDAITAGRAIGPGEATGAALPTEDALMRLETLRQSLETVTNYERDGAPLRLRWGLYSGSAMLNPVRRVYYNKFRQLLFGTTQERLLTFLQQTPATAGPNDDYSFAYDTLKAYLLTTPEWKRSSDPALQQFLGSRLLARWSAGRDAQIGAKRMELAKLQFDFYARDLQNGNPYSATGDAPAIDRSRLYLSKFGGIERVYRFLLSEAAKNNPPMNFNGKFPGSSQAVTSTVDVSYAYTREGWKIVQDLIRKQNYAGEPWVLGPYLGQGFDKAAMEKGIMERYTTDYIDTWRRVLRGSRVNGYANAQDASRKLDILTSNNAPLLALFWWTSYHTTVDLPGVADKFKPVQVVVPFSTNQQYVLPPNAAYNTGLIGLKQAVDRVANREPEAERGMRDTASTATATTKQLSQTFPPEPEGKIDVRSEELLLQPIKNLEGLIGGDLRSGGAAFCASFSALTNKFPFNPTAMPEVSLAELADILQPNTGKLWSFYNNTVKSAMTCQNGQCTPTGNPPLNPAFVRFFSQLMQFSRALYGEAGTEPTYRYSLRPQASDRVEVFTVTVNGDVTQMKGGQQKAYVWPGTGTRNFRLSLKQPGATTPLDVQNEDTVWAVFRFFADADRTSPSGSGYNFEWVLRQGRENRPVMIGGRQFTYDFFVDTAGGPAVFSKDFLSTLRCVGPLAR